ncbi:MAG: hypothetical protein WAqPseu_00300 [Shewanella algae]
MTRSELASQIWALLALAVNNLQSLSHGVLLKLTGILTTDLGQFLELIQAKCLIHELHP